MLRISALLLAILMILLPFAGWGDETPYRPWQQDIPPTISQRHADALALISHDRYAEAEQSLTTLIGDTPNYYQAHRSLADLLLRQGKAAAALTHYQHALQLWNRFKIEDYSIFLRLADGYAAAKIPDEAELYYLKSYNYDAMHNQQVNEETLLGLGRLYLTLDEPELARNYLKIAEISHKSSEATALLATLDQPSVLATRPIEAAPNIEPSSDVLAVARRQATFLGNRIWLNESNGELSGLTIWGWGEDHASMGIGHFIWYPQGKIGPFDEQFPLVVDYLAAHGAAIPDWLRQQRHSQWPDRKSFRAAQKSDKIRELRDLLRQTVDLQAMYIIERLGKAMPKILATLPANQRSAIQQQFDRIAHQPDGQVSLLGLYLLADYLNFKGDGTSEKERYANQGWGLKQVLQMMEGSSSATARSEFADCAERVLIQRISNAPPFRNESRWWPGWQRRIESYRAGS